MGFRDKALRQYKKCEVILKAELEVEPTKQTRQLYLEIRNDRLSSTHSRS
jgi:DNA-binding SARP family transcriptional activator